MANPLNNIGVRFTLVSGAAVLTDFILAFKLKTFTAPRSRSAPPGPAAFA